MANPSNYPTSLDTTSTISNSRAAGNGDPAGDHNILANANLALQAKLGYGTATAAGASTGQVLTKNSDGSTGWVSPSAAGSTTLTGDVIGSGTSSITTTLATTGVTAGTYSYVTVTVDAKGRVTAINSNPGPIPPRVTTGTYASTVTVSNTQEIYRLTMTGSPTINFATGAFDGQKIELHLIQDSTGSRTVTWGTNTKFASGAPAPTLTTTAGAEDVLGFRWDAATSKWRYYGIVPGF